MGKIPGPPYRLSYQVFKSIGIDIFACRGMLNNIKKEEKNRIISILQEHLPEMLILKYYRPFDMSPVFSLDYYFAYVNVKFGSNPDLYSTGENRGMPEKFKAHNFTRHKDGYRICNETNTVRNVEFAVAKQLYTLENDWSK